MKVTVANKNYYLTSDLNDDDFPALMKHLSNRDMSKFNVLIPYPFTDKHAQGCINDSKIHIATYGPFSTAVIRDEDSKLIGEIGFDFEYRNVAEISYWLAKPYWSFGIMTSVVGRMCQVGFKKFKLKKIIAFAQARNAGSTKVLERNGFVQESLLKDYVQDVIDVKVFGLTKAMFNG